MASIKGMELRRLTPIEANDRFKKIVRSLGKGPDGKGGELEMAHLLRCSPTTIYNIINGGRPSMETANCIEALFLDEGGAPQIPMNSWIDPPQIETAQRVAG
jgi:hypothetical protein